MSEKGCHFLDKRVRFSITIFSACINCEVRATFVYALKRVGTNIMFLSCYMQLGFCELFL